MKSKPTPTAKHAATAADTPKVVNPVVTNTTKIDPANDITTFTLTLAELHQFDEATTDDFDEQRRTAIADCRRRPKVGRERLMTLKVRLMPNKLVNTDVDVSVQFTSELPPWSSDQRKRRAKSTPKNELQLCLSFDTETA